MITQDIYNLSASFMCISFTLIAIYIFYKCIKMANQYATIPTDERTLVKADNNLLVKADKDVLKEYEKMSVGLTQNIVKAYTTSVSNVVPIRSREELEKDLQNDVFLKAAVNEYLPNLYLRFGGLLAAITVPITTASHVDYEKLKEKFAYQNDSITCEEEPESCDEKGGRGGGETTDI